MALFPDSVSNSDEESAPATSKRHSLPSAKRSEHRFENKTELERVTFWHKRNASSRAAAGTQTNTKTVSSVVSVSSVLFCTSFLVAKTNVAGETVPPDSSTSVASTATAPAANAADRKSAFAFAFVPHAGSRPTPTSVSSAARAVSNDEGPSASPSTRKTNAAWCDASCAIALSAARRIVSRQPRPLPGAPRGRAQPHRRTSAKRFACHVCVSRRRQCVSVAAVASSPNTEDARNDATSSARDAGGNEMSSSSSSFFFVRAGEKSSSSSPVARALSSSSLSRFVCRARSGRRRARLHQCTASPRSIANRYREELPGFQELRAGDASFVASREDAAAKPASSIFLARFAFGRIARLCRGLWLVALRRK
mmetsp:Transcript_9103/g.38263  ORF Transcript_9103/g.38263 Transcript_9103/m.38263 type:complete len:367 (-) Transcript_9103:210-1310(-)